MRKTGWLAVLLVVNIGLLAALILAITEPRTANAQVGGLAGNYLVITGEVQDEYDALYIIDMKERQLHAMAFRRGSRDLEYGGYRLLDQDFRYNREQPVEGTP